MVRSSDRKKKSRARTVSERARETQRMTLHDMPTMPPQVIEPDLGWREPGVDVTSLLPAPTMEGESSFESVTTYLTPRQAAFLKSLSTVIRTKSGIFVTQSELLRAMVDAIMESGIDLSDATGEADLKQLLSELLE